MHRAVVVLGRDEHRVAAAHQRGAVGERDRHRLFLPPVERDLAHRAGRLEPVGHENRDLRLALVGGEVFTVYGQRSAARVLPDLIAGTATSAGCGLPVIAAWVWSAWNGYWFWSV